MLHCYDHINDQSISKIMKLQKLTKHILTLLGILMAFPIIARDFDYTYEGQTITYTVLDEKAKTVETKQGKESTPTSLFPGNTVTGALILPANPKDGEEEYELVTIGFGSFSSCTELTSLTLPESVISIGSSAFYGCTGLSAITIPEGVSSIGEQAFYHCESLTTIQLPSSLTTVGEDAFGGCKGLTAVETDSLEAWLNIDFENQSSNPIYYAKKLVVNGETIRKLTIPEGVTRINKYAFYGYPLLQTVTMPASITTVGYSAFKGCSGLHRVIFPDELTLLKLTYEEENGWADSGPIRCYTDAKYYIGNEEFNPEYLVIPAALTEIPEYALCGYENMKSVTMHEGIKSIGRQAFAGCDALTEVRVPSINAWARIQFGNDDANPLSYAHNLYVGDATEPVKTIVIEGEDPISDYAFYDATCLERVRVKDGASIGYATFKWCTNITDLCVNSPAFDNWTFYGCDNIKNIYVPRKTPPVAYDNAFSNYTDVNVYVPEGCVAAYETYDNADGCWWRFFIYESNFSELDSIFVPDYEGSGAAIQDVDAEVAFKPDLAGNIFTLQGVCMKRNATQEDVKALAPGIYIVGGKKVVVK